CPPGCAREVRVALQLEVPGELPATLAHLPPEHLRAVLLGCLAVELQALVARLRLEGVLVVLLELLEHLLVDVRGQGPFPRGGHRGARRRALVAEDLVELVAVELPVLTSD